MRKNQTRAILMGQIVAGVLSLAAVSLTAKYVGPLIFSFGSIFLLVLNISITVLDYGACSWAARELAASSISTTSFNSINNSKTRLLALIIFLIPIYISFASSEYKFGVLLFLYPALWNRSNFNQQYCLAKGMIRESVTLVISDRLCWLLIVPLSVINSDKLLAFSLPIILGLIVQNILFVILSSHQGSVEVDDFVFSQRDLFKKSKHFGIIGISSVLSNFDGVFLSSVIGLEASSGYLLAQRFRNPLTIIFNSVAMRLRPIAVSRDRLLIMQALKSDAKLLLFGLLLNLITAFIFLFYSTRYFGRSYEYVNMFLFFGTLSSIPLGILLVSSNLLSALGREKYSASVNSSYSVFALVGVFLGALIFGGLGQRYLYFSLFCFTHS